MSEWIKKLPETHKAVLFSLFFHLTIILILVLLKVKIDTTPAEFAEMSFLAPGQSDITRIRQARPGSSPANQTASPNITPPENDRAVEVPTRRMLEQEESVLLPQQRDKLTPNASSKPISPSSDYGRYEQYQTDYAGTQHKATAKAADLDEKPQPGTAVDDKTSAQQQIYSIEGEAANREVVHKVIPGYPPDVQKEAVVRVKFWVLPNGSVGQMIPVQKGAPRLEEITLKALKQWRFSPLPSDAEQKNVQGIITFRYKLR